MAQGAGLHHHHTRQGTDRGEPGGEPVERRGSVHSADGWRALLVPVIARYRGRMKRRYFRADAAFANPDV